MNSESDHRAPLLSVIVPVYGVEPYLRRCVDSVLGQTMPDLECILVDDGSPDGCGGIIDAYAAADPRVVAIHQGNRGVSAARNAGLAVARGEYVGFVDPDDWADPGMYEELASAAEASGAGLAACGWRSWAPSGGREDHELRLPEEMDARSFALELFSRPRTVGGSCCNKLFRRSRLAGRFDESVAMGEDNLFLGAFLVGRDLASCVPRPLYNVRERGSSATRREPGAPALALPARRRLICEMAALGRDVRDAAEADFLDSCLMFARAGGASRCRALAVEELVAYCRRNALGVLRNTAMPPKEKALALATAVGCSWRGCRILGGGN